MWSQRFIQAILLMPIFERRLSFRIVYFAKNIHKIILKCRWRPGDVVNSADSLWQSLGEDQGVNPQENYGLFTSGGQINSLKYSRNKGN